MAYEEVEGGNVPIKAWTIGVPFEHGAKVQLRYAAMLPFVQPHIAVMPDAHVGIGCTVGAVIPTYKAIIPACVGVDIGCGMVAVRTDLTSHSISESGNDLFEALSNAIPVGVGKGHGEGSWAKVPESSERAWEDLESGLRTIRDSNSKISPKNAMEQLGTLGSGNHFVNVSLDEQDRVWFMLHSGSRGIGNKIGTHFIELARKDMERQDKRLPNRDLAYFEEGSEHFSEYTFAVLWAQEYARINRQLMLGYIIKAARKVLGKFMPTDEAVECHHNFVQRETHFGQDLWVTRKGAVQAKLGQLGIIPGCMGGKSFIVSGKGNPDSFETCSHGAGRMMSRTQARQSITLKMHREATEGIFCRKDKDVIDESPSAYKNVDLVMQAQADLVDIVHTLQEIVNVKG